MGPRARRILVMAIGAVALVVGGAGVALASGDDPGSGTGPGVAPAGDVSATTTIDVSDEATYRQALIDLSACDGPGRLSAARRSPWRDHCYLFPWS